MTRIKLLLLIITSCAVNAVAQNATSKWTPESTEIWEPQPRIVTPPSTPGGAPADATILFDGKSLSNWESTDGGAATWTLKEGAMTVLPGAKDIRTKKEFGDFQLHIEWR